MCLTGLAGVGNPIRQLGERCCPFGFVGVGRNGASSGVFRGRDGGWESFFLFSSSGSESVLVVFLVLEEVLRRGLCGVLLPLGVGVGVSLPLGWW